MSTATAPKEGCVQEAVAFVDSIAAFIKTAIPVVYDGKKIITDIIEKVCIQIKKLRS